MVFICLPATLYGQKYSGDSWKKVQTTGRGTITCIYYESPGLIYKENNEMKGVCVDILNDFTAFIKDKYNKSLQLNFAGQEQVFTKFLNHVKTNSNILGVTNTTITAERKKIFTFSPAYISNPMVLLTNKNTPVINDLNEISQKFDGYTAVVITGSTHVGYIQDIKSRYYPDLKIEYAPNGDVILDRIINDNKTFTVIDFTEYFGSVKRHLPIQRHNIKLGEESEQLGFVMQKGSDWEPLWNEFLTHDYKNSIRYRKIISDNLGNSFLGLIR